MPGLSLAPSSSPHHEQRGLRKASSFPAAARGNTAGAYALLKPVDAVAFLFLVPSVVFALSIPGRAEVLSDFGVSCPSRVSSRTVQV